MDRVTVSLTQHTYTVPQLKVGNDVPKHMGFFVVLNYKSIVLELEYDSLGIMRKKGRVAGLEVLFPIIPKESYFPRPKI